MARITELPDVIEPSPELEALTRNVQRTFSEIVEQIPYLPEELQLAVANIDDPAALGHLIAGALRIGTEEKQKLLEEVDVAKRLRHLSRILARELEVVQLGTQIQTQVQSEIDKGQREFFLRQQLKAIQDELGEEDEQQAEVERTARADRGRRSCPSTRCKAADRELARLEKLPPAAAEHGVIRTYLEWLVELPWSQETEDNLDIKHARKVLDADHYDLEKVKDRILEYLAVRKLNPDSPGPILCFVGPPGVGKTSLGRSIAKALGREFERISVGGVRDEAEIRGHRRTYIGALPGTIIRALRDAGSRNPVFMIDEIDKMGADFRGDPASAMLEVLDPAQNDSFRDHYLDLEFDLSDVVFIATANVLDTIPGPLLDRMETIELAGYTLDEKRHIARRYLVDRQIAANGLKPSQIEFADAALTAIIEEYTREAGVRNLERQIGTICRKVAREVAEGKAKGKVRVSGKKARELLGRRRVFAEQRRRTKVPGVATGLAWTPTGGDVLFIEATAMPGSGKLTITGQLGDVMKESAQAALSYVRGHWAEIAPKLGEDWFAEHDIHIHVPAGAVPKDGPSAGVAMTVALVLAGQRPTGSQRCGDDRRGDPDGAGAADRRPEGEVAGGAAGGDQAGDRAGAQRGRRRGDPRARARRPRVRLRRRGLQGARRSPLLGRRWRRRLSAGAVRRHTRRSLARGGAGALARLLDRRRADRAGGGAALRHARRAELPPRRGRHRQPRPPRRLRPRDGRGRLQRVGAAALLRAGLGLDPADRDRRVRAALALGRWPGWRRSRSPTWSAPSCAAAAPACWRRRWSRSTRCCSGTRRRRGPTRCWCCSARSRCSSACAPLRNGAAPRLRAAGGSASGLALATHYFAVFPIARRGAAAAAPARRARASPGSGSSPPSRSLLAPLAIHQMSYGHAEWIGNFTLGHRLWETAATFVIGETGDIIGRPERPGARLRAAGALPRRASPCWRCAATATERRAAALPLLGRRRRDRDPGGCWRCSPRARTSSSPAT